MLKKMLAAVRWCMRYVLIGLIVAYGIFFIKKRPSTSELLAVA